jgi:Fe-S-cluster containining protein
LIVEADIIDFLREPKLAIADPHYASLPILEIQDQLMDDFRCILLALPGRSCPFLDENKCSIYPTRPNNCVAMEAGDEQCQMAREAEGLEPLQPVGNSSGNSSDQ